ncbi:phosphatase PAP2 family protein [Bartonella sp. TP]|uniref:phosphatase PAP2 family protein n=1 Tax=Bartonella sp. TP TaxID=3057550 RepID=UPI0025B12E80|nr:phosphatase PAP2 family protein [Bartonella sp. TP]MDN5249163.1 phosphatase PAP2 family protein [Alphaproteobacteria bacterium]WJW80125.1 phosphatase PAP2 family protein [Bartonella sp. TP]
MLTNIDNFLLLHMAGKYMYPGAIVPHGLFFFAIICAKWLTYFIPLHLLWLSINWLTSSSTIAAEGCRFRRLVSPLVAKILLSIGIALLLSFLFGCFYHRPRPFVVYPDIALLLHTASPSFPSDHATIWAAYCYMLYKNQQCKKDSYNIVYVAIALALLTCWGRIFVGIHYPFDILGGAILGLFCAFAVDKFVPCSNK